jgi:hypothetical protein
VNDWGFYGGYAYLSHPGRVEIDWDQLEQQSWAKQVPLDLTRISSVRFNLERPATFQYSVANLRFLPLGQTGDTGAVTLTGVAWNDYAGAGSTAQLTLSGPLTWGTKGTSVNFGWNTLDAPLPGGGMDLTAFRGLAFEIEGQADRTYAIQGLTEADNGPETMKGRGANLK